MSIPFGVYLIDRFTGLASWLEISAFGPNDKHLLMRNIAKFRLLVRAYYVAL